MWYEGIREINFNGYSVVKIKDDKMVGEPGGREKVWVSENWSGLVHFDCHSPEWRVVSNSSVQP